MSNTSVIDKTNPFQPSIDKSRDFKEHLCNQWPPLGWYFSDSEFYSLKYGFVAEVIKDPGSKFLRAGLLARVRAELGSVALQAFGKGETEVDTYVPSDVMDKNAIWVDWLIVVRKKNHVVAFGSATFIASFLLYLSSAMVLPVEQTTGVGVIANSLLWKLAIEEARRNGIIEPDVICRTHNRNVASVLLHLLKNATLSTEPGHTLYNDMIFDKTKNYLKCNFNKETGISYDVYPGGLPSGEKSQNQRINNGFKNVGPRDACYVLGNLNLEYIEKLHIKYVKKSEKQFECKITETFADTLVPTFA